MQITAVVDKQLEDLIVVASRSADDRRARAEQQEGAVVGRDLLIEGHRHFRVQVEPTVRKQVHVLKELEEDRVLE